MQRMKKLGVGIIGTGGIANTAHAPAITILDRTELVAVLSRDEERGKAFLDQHSAQDATAHTLLNSFVDDQRIDLVIVCSPDSLHAEQAEACLNNGKHVLVEKPMTIDTNQANAIVSLANEKHLTLSTGFHLRSHNGHQLLHEKLLDHGDIGNVRHIRATWAFPQQDDSNWRAKEDLTKWWSLSAVGSHCIDLVRWFADDMEDWNSFKSVTANNIWSGPHDETTVIAAQTRSGITAEIVSSVQFGPYNRLEIFGDKGFAVCEGTMGREGAGKISINGSAIEFEVHNPYVSQLSDVVECMETGKNPRANGLVGLRSVKDLSLVLK